MTDFDPGVHTPDALVCELSQLAETVPAALVVGSLGRAAFYGRTLGDPAYEYRQRGQAPIRSFYGGPADIDLLGVPDFDEDVGPFSVDPRTFGGRQVAIVQRGGRWELRY